MADRYFYAHGGLDHGPYSAMQMRALADSGQILPADDIWKQGTTHRVPAAQVPNLHGRRAADTGSAATGPVMAETASAPAGPVEVVDVAPAAPLETPATAATAPIDEGDRRPAPRVKPAPVQERPKRIVEIRGGILCSQDGVYVRFKKKCDHCGHEEAARSTALIRTGSTRVPFYCTQCRKCRTVEMRGIT